MLAADRRAAILRTLQAGGSARVADLAAQLDVSEMTVRRDLDALHAQDLLRKVHGGAVVRHNRGEEPWSSVKASQQRAEKEAIAAVAASTVEDGMTIAISAGTTTTELARRLARRPSITVITNSLRVFETLTDPSGDGEDGPQAYLSGGVRTPSDALVGPIADNAIGSFRVDASYLGVHGFDPQGRADLAQCRRGADESGVDRHRRPTVRPGRPHQVPGDRHQRLRPGSTGSTR
jgi:DeoR/GlpR family transcriptional regulator of sugar metabolism